MKKLLITLFALGSILPSFAKVLTPRDQVNPDDGYNHFVGIIFDDGCTSTYDHSFHTRYLGPNLYEAWTLVPSFMGVQNGNFNDDDDDLYSSATLFFERIDDCTLSPCKVVRVNDPVTGKVRLHITCNVSTSTNMYDVLDSFVHEHYPTKITISEPELNV